MGKVLNKRSSVLDHTPSSDGIEYGELAVNYASGEGSSFLVAKKSDNTIAKFHEDDYWKKYVSDSIDSLKNTYELSLNDEGVLYCTKNGTEDGFEISDDGIVSLA